MKNMKSLTGKQVGTLLRKWEIPSFRALWIFVTVGIVLCGGCAKDSEPPALPKSTEKMVLSVTVPNCCFNDNTSDIEIDQNKRIVYIRLDYRQDIAAIEPKITISPKATISPKSGTKQNFIDPVDYTVTAEDGSSVVYKFIVTQVSGGQGYHEEFFFSTGSVENFHHDARFWSGQCCPDDFNGIHLSFGRGNNQFILNLINKNLNQNLVGQYIIQKPCVNACSTAIYLYDNGTPKLLVHPYNGTITITKYDRPNKLISGAYQNVRFKEQTEYPQFSFSGEFINVPLR